MNNQEINQEDKKEKINDNKNKKKKPFFQSIIDDKDEFLRNLLTYSLFSGSFYALIKLIENLISRYNSEKKEKEQVLIQPGQQKNYSIPVPTDKVLINDNYDKIIDFLKYNPFLSLMATTGAAKGFIKSLDKESKINKIISEYKQLSHSDIKNFGILPNANFTDNSKQQFTLRINPYLNILQIPAYDLQSTQEYLSSGSNKAYYQKIYPEIYKNLDRVTRNNQEIFDEIYEKIKKIEKDNPANINSRLQAYKIAYENYKKIQSTKEILPNYQERTAKLVKLINELSFSLPLLDDAINDESLQNKVQNLTKDLSLVFNEKIKPKLDYEIPQLGASFLQDLKGSALGYTRKLRNFIRNFELKHVLGLRYDSPEFKKLFADYILNKHLQPEIVSKQIYDLLGQLKDHMGVANIYHQNLDENKLNQMIHNYVHNLVDLTFSPAGSKKLNIKTDFTGASQEYIDLLGARLISSKDTNTSKKQNVYSSTKFIEPQKVTKPDQIKQEVEKILRPSLGQTNYENMVFPFIDYLIKEKPETLQKIMKPTIRGTAYRILSPPLIYGAGGAAVGSFLDSLLLPGREAIVKS